MAQIARFKIPGFPLVIDDLFRRPSCISISLGEAGWRVPDIRQKTEKAIFYVETSRKSHRPNAGGDVQMLSRVC
jgi:hypothetical protein